MATQMKMQMGLKKMVEFSKSFWSKIATKAITQIRLRSDKGIGVRDSGHTYHFPAYSDKYKEMKARGMRKKKGGKYASVSGIGTDKQVNPPNFRLRGRTLGDLRNRYITKDHAVIGWAGEYAEIVDAHDKKKKFQVGGLSDRELDTIRDELGKEVERNWNKKVKNITVVVKS